MQMGVRMLPEDRIRLIVSRIQKVYAVLFAMTFVAVICSAVGITDASSLQDRLAQLPQFQALEIFFQGKTREGGT